MQAQTPLPHLYYLPLSSKCLNEALLLPEVLCLMSHLHTHYSPSPLYSVTSLLHLLTGVSRIMVSSLTHLCTYRLPSFTFLYHYRPHFSTNDPFPARNPGLLSYSPSYTSINRTFPALFYIYICAIPCVLAWLCWVAAFRLRLSRHEESVDRQSTSLCLATLLLSH